MLKYLPELLSENVISQEVADKISDYYLFKRNKSQNNLIMIFGLLGALLIGLGLILIVEYNWYNFPKILKTNFAFLPLLISQLLCGYTILKKRSNVIWRDTVGCLLTFSLGSSILLISQIYQINGNLGQFLLLWSLLSLPIIYLLNSSFTSLLYIIGITAYVCESGYGYQTDSNPLFYWLLIIAVLPHYIRLIKVSTRSNFVIYHNVFISISIIIALGTLASTYPEIMYISYFSLFGVLLNLSNLEFFQKHNVFLKSFSFLGSVGTMILLYMLSFNEFWKNWNKVNFNISGVLFSQEMFSIVILSSLATYLLIKKYKTHRLNKRSPIEFIFLAFIVLFVIGHNYPNFAIVSINSLILLIGISTILSGLKYNRIGILNIGLSIVIILILCRFFENDFSFIVRGLIFVFVGIGFFLANYRMLKIRKSNES
ncbi:MAG: DUF2157 domain-containing protein [Candidatus Kapabacteria bacterium]|nr:DUF2157 domain-containing protein [Candidatus Kapabacteria bacterium]